MIGMSVFRMQAIPRQSAMPESFRRRAGRTVQKEGGFHHLMERFICRPDGV